VISRKIPFYLQVFSFSFFIMFVRFSLWLHVKFQLDIANNMNAKWVFI
jgi:hypothetical protein